jgi:23S rRNA (uracil1939-C5)-methyltransferase
MHPQPDGGAQHFGFALFAAEDQRGFDIQISDAHHQRVTTRQIITVDVTDLDPFGQGVARHNGKALFIPGLLPGERAEITLTEEKRQYARGQVKRRLNDSPERVIPRCPHYGVCGGCQQQHASVALQEKSKSSALARLLKNEVNDIIADKPWGYRRRARLSLSYQPKTGRWTHKAKG